MSETNIIKRKVSEINSARLAKRDGEGGFTLVELLIVIVILAILAAIVVFAVGTTTKNAVAASCNADAKSIETAVAAYSAQTGGPPAALSSLTTTTAASGGGTVGPWLRSLPSTGHYNITSDLSGNIYVLAPSSTTATANSNNFDLTPSICGTFS